MAGHCCSCREAVEMNVAVGRRSRESDSFGRRVPALAHVVAGIAAVSTLMWKHFLS